jgi:hypothetical protein
METKALLLGSKLKHSGEIFHTADKKVWGQRVSLSNSTVPRKEPMNITINYYSQRGSRYILHNKRNKFSWKAKVAKEVFQEFPLDRVKSLFKINFQQIVG